MGAFGVGPLENDAALDLIDSVAKEGCAPVQQALEHVLGSSRTALESSAASRVAASAELVAIAHAQHVNSAAVAELGISQAVLMRLRELGLRARKQGLRWSVCRANRANSMRNGQIQGFWINGLTLSARSRTDLAMVVRALRRFHLSTAYRFPIIFRIAFRRSNKRPILVAKQSIGELAGVRAKIAASKECLEGRF